MRSTHTLSKIEEEEGGPNWRHDVASLPYVCVCTGLLIYTRGSGYNIQQKREREREGGVTKVQQQQQAGSNSRSLQNIRSVFFVTFMYIFFFFLSPICWLIWRVPLSCLSVCLCALLLAIQARKNNKPRDTIQILDVISLLSGSKGKEEMCAYCTTEFP